MRAFALLLLLAFPACPPPAEEPQWYLTCGDPVCQGYTGPFDGVPLCTDEAIGDACVTEGEQCDPVDDCNALLRCTTEDPTTQPGGCPISLAKYKRDIRYLGGDERSALAKRALGTKLATWSYRWDPPGSRERLGFIIDDDPASPAVTDDGGHVDLYGYTSMAIAAAQDQEARIAAQERRLAEQEARIAAQEKEIAALRAMVEGRTTAP